MKSTAEECVTCGGPLHASGVCPHSAADTGPTSDTIVFPGLASAEEASQRQYPSGWYPDPHHQGYDRWHDGSDWRDEWRPAATSTVPPSALLAQVPHTWEHPSAVTTVARASSSGGNGFVIAIAWITALITFGYMLPWAVAATTGRNVAGTFVVNLLLGWTLIGWLAALVMAFSGSSGSGQAVAVTQQANPTINVYLPPAAPTPSSAQTNTPGGTP